MSSIQIREASTADAASISSLMKELGYDLPSCDTADRIAVYLDSLDTVLVAEDEDGVEVVGFVSFHVIPLFHAASNLGRITAMCVTSSRQRQGIGRALLTALDGAASNRGCVRIEVTSGDYRAEDAHRFYQSCGYSIDSRRFQKFLNQA